MRVRNLINGYGISRGSRTSAPGHVQLETNHFLPHLSLLCAGDRSGVPPLALPAFRWRAWGYCTHAGTHGSGRTQGCCGGAGGIAQPQPFLAVGSTAPTARCFS